MDFSRYSEKAYSVFRVFIGLLFFQHGAQKIFGWFGGQSAEILSMMGIAGIIELVGGLAIAFGLFSSIAALISGLQMLIAYAMVHFPQGLIPIVNKGELALLYFAAFLVIMTKGSGEWSIDSIR